MNVSIPVKISNLLPEVFGKRFYVYICHIDGYVLSLSNSKISNRNVFLQVTEELCPPLERDALEQQVSNFINENVSKNGHLSMDSYKKLCDVLYDQDIPFVLYSLGEDGVFRETSVINLYMKLVGTVMTPDDLQEVCVTTSYEGDIDKGGFK